MTTPDQPGARGLRIGFFPGVTLTKWRRIWADRFRRVPLEVTEIAEADQRRALASREVDMCFVRLPVERDGLHAIPLYDEIPVVWMHKDFLLAALDEVTAEDLADFRVVEDYSPDSIDLAVYSAAVLRVPMSVARTQSRRDMVSRPVIDADPTTIALAWRTDNENEWIDEFVGVVRGRTPNSSRTARERNDDRPGTERTGPGRAAPRRLAASAKAGSDRRGRSKRPRRR